MKELNTMQEHFMRSLLDGKREISNEEIENRLSFLSLTWLSPPFVVADISPDYSNVSYSSKDSTIAEIREYIYCRLEKAGVSGFIIPDSYNNFLVVFSSSENRKNEAENINLDDFLTELHKKIQLKFEQELFIGIGRKVDSLSNINESLADAREMLGFKYQYSDRGVINISNAIPFQKNSMIGSNIEFERVIGCFKDGDLVRMQHRLDELVAYVRNRPNVSNTSIRRTLTEIVIRILNIASDANIEVEDVLEGKDPYLWILRQNHTEVITEWIMNISSVLVERMRERKELEVKSIIVESCNYIKNNIQDGNLGLQSVSAFAGLSPTYFSRLFKEETGTGINVYITAEKIERAKFALKSTNAKIEDISKQLGFNTTSYFNTVFSKNVGVTPGQFRKNCRMALPEEKI